MKVACTDAVGAGHFSFCEDNSHTR